MSELKELAGILDLRLSQSNTLNKDITFSGMVLTGYTFEAYAYTGPNESNKITITVNNTDLPNGKITLLTNGLVPLLRGRDDYFWLLRFIFPNTDKRVMLQGRVVIE
jgi:hypothetical protein